MKLFKRKKDIAVKACASGQVISLKEVDDPMFSAGLMGPGLAIESIDGKVYSPVDGKISMVFPTNHAFGIELEGGQQLLIHVGIDTVNLKGEGFISHIKDHQKVKTGDLLLEFDLNLLKTKGYPSMVIMCISEPKEITVTLADLSKVVASKDEIITIKQ